MTYLFLLDPDYIYLFPNASISECGPDKLRLVLVKGETPSELSSYVYFVSLQAFCKLEDGLCVSSPICGCLKCCFVGSNYKQKSGL